MTKSFVFLTLFLSLIIVHNCSAAPRKLSVFDSDQDESDSSSDATDYDFDSGADSEFDSETYSEFDSETDYEFDSETDFETENIGNDTNLTLNCVLFGNKGCDIECAIVAKAYNRIANGICTVDQYCHCYVPPIPFEHLWKNKFHTGYVYHNVINNEILLQAAHHIFDFPLRTADQCKALFQPYLSPYQFSKLKTNDQSPAAGFTKKDVDTPTAAIRIYVSEEVGKMLKSSGESVLSAQYKQNFRQALENSKDNEGTLYNLVSKTHYLGNHTLEEILKAWLKKNNLNEPEVELPEKKDLIEILFQTVTNEIIKQNDEKNAVRSSKKEVAKKPAAVKRSPRFKSAGKSSLSF